jgi:hypothetical protein
MVLKKGRRSKKNIRPIIIMFAKSEKTTLPEAVSTTRLIGPPAIPTRKYAPETGNPQKSPPGILSNNKEP